jgi:hypothetical protein
LVTKILTTDGITKNFVTDKYSDVHAAWYLAAKRSYIAVTDAELYKLVESENEPTIFFSLLQNTTLELLQICT